MKCSRTIIYFSMYRHGVKAESVGHAVLWQNGAACRLEYHYRSTDNRAVTPIYYFAGGASITGEPMEAVGCIKTSSERFLGSEKKASDLEAICFLGTPEKYSGGRLDGQELHFEYGETEMHPAQIWMDTVTEAVAQDTVSKTKEAENVSDRKEAPGITEEAKGPAAETHVKESEKTYEAKEKAATETTSESAEAAPITYTLPELLSVLPTLTLPPDGMRRQCRRMDLTDFAKFPKKWTGLEKNHFLLHGYYRYHHLLFAQICNAEGEQYVIGVPGEFYYRDQYMAETFGFSTFHPIKNGNRRRGEFGYWYMYLT